MKKVIVYSTTLVVIAYAVFLGAFLGWPATGFIISVWIALISFSRIVARPVGIVLTLIIACLLVLVPVNLNFTSYLTLSDSAIFTFKAAANVDFSTSFEKLPPFWWIDILMKFIVAVVVTGLCAIARAEPDNRG
jgi:hypothetical protein